jgi:hypothetical protein
VRERVLLSDRYDQTNEIQSETRGVHRGGHGGVTGRCARPVRPDQRVRSPHVWLFHEPTTLFFRGLLYILVGRLLEVSLRHLIYLWAYWAELKPPLSSQLISLAFDCDSRVRLSDSSASIIDLHLEALGGLICCGFSCYSWWFPPPRRLGAAWRCGKCWWLFLATSCDLVRGLHLHRWSAAR